jgi:hypothetical protein
MAVRQPTRKKLYKTMQGRLVDIEKMRAVNENVQAVGNMNVNARGDILGKGGKVVKTKAEVMKQYYQTPKGKAQDVPNKKAQKPAQVAEPIQQPKVQQVRTINPTQQTKDQTTTAGKSTDKKGIDAALDGLE